MTNNTDHTDNPEFPAALKLNRLAFGANVLNHIRTRPGLNVGHIGEKLQPVLSNFRAILPEHLDIYYELLTGVLTQLSRYSELAESCSKSGAYQDRRQEQLNTVLQAMNALEVQDDLLAMFESMRRQ